MISGVIPEAVNGMSSCLNVNPIVPFCAARDENLSPISGTLIDLTFVLHIFIPCSLFVNKTDSTVPLSLCLNNVELSFLSYPFTDSPKLEVFPIMTSFVSKNVPGLTNPSSSM